MKKILYLSLGLILSITLITGCGCSKTDDTKKDDTDKQQQGPTANTNTDVVKDQTVDVFKFEKTSLVYEDGNSKLQTTVTNTSSELQQISEFKIHFKDEAGNEIVTLTGFVGGELQAGESQVISSFYGDDLTQANSIEYEIVK